MDGMSIDTGRRTRAGFAVLLAIGAAVVTLGIITAVAIPIALNQVKENGPAPARYFQALQNQNYTLAYALLAKDAKVQGQTLDRDTFVTRAAEADAKNGPIGSYGILKDENQPGHYTVDLSRRGQHYKVDLYLSDGSANEISGVGGF